MRYKLIRNNQYNIGHICTTQQCEAGLGKKVAMRWLSPRLERSDYIFFDLEHSSNRFANLLRGLGVAKGEVLFTFLPKSTEQVVAFLGSLKPNTEDSSAHCQPPLFCRHTAGGAAA
jgi:acetyl-CoA synthetase